MYVKSLVWACYHIIRKFIWTFSSLSARLWQVFPEYDIISEFIITFITLLVFVGLEMVLFSRERTGIFASLEVFCLEIFHQENKNKR